MTSATRALRAVALALGMAALVLPAACGKDKSAPAPPGVAPVPVSQIPGHEQVGEDTAIKEAPRLVPQEAYMRTYLQLFGGLAPIDVQRKIKAGSSGLFDTWNDYLTALGLPDYRLDLPRATQTNSLMLATFERLGVALCDKAVERDLRAGAGDAAARPVFAFDLPPEEPDLPTFTTRFDVLHRTFLGYPAALAETDRTARFFALYTQTVAAHAAPAAAKSAFTPAEAGWASVCYGLVRHPEFHLY